MFIAEAILLTTLPDRHGAPLAEYYYRADTALLYIRWHGNITAAEVIRGVEEALRLMREYPYQRVLNDKRETSGDWSEALPWLQYEWLPQAVAAGLRAVAYIVSPDLPAQMVSQEFVEAVQDRLHISLFTTEEDARRWLRTQ